MGPKRLDASAEWVAIAKLGRARGIRGELLAEPLTDRPDRFATLERVQLRRADGNVDRMLRLQNQWWHGHRLVLKFEGVDSMDDAEKLAGLLMTVGRDERAVIEEGEYFLDDLVGCRMFEAGTARDLGEVTGWQDSGGPLLLEVGRMMVPFAKEICIEIDPAAGRIVVKLPAGLEELYSG